MVLKKLLVRLGYTARSLAPIILGIVTGLCVVVLVLHFTKKNRPATPVTHAHISPLFPDCRFQLSGEIDHDMLQQFRTWIIDINSPQITCKEATLFLNSYGGDTSVAYEIITLLRHSEVPINTTCLAHCSSAALMIFSQGTGSRIVTDFTSGTFHAPSFNYQPSDKDKIHSYKTFHSRFLPQFPEDIRIKIASGEDVTLTKDDLIKSGFATHTAKLSNVPESKDFDLGKYLSLSLHTYDLGSRKSERITQSSEACPAEASFTVFKKRRDLFICENGKFYNLNKKLPMTESMATELRACAFDNNVEESENFRTASNITYASINKDELVTLQCKSKKALIKITGNKSSIQEFTVRNKIPNSKDRPDVYWF